MARFTWPHGMSSASDQRRLRSARSKKSRYRRYRPARRSGLSGRKRFVIERFPTVRVRLLGATAEAKGEPVPALEAVALYTLPPRKTSPRKRPPPKPRPEELTG